MKNSSTQSVTMQKTALVQGEKEASIDFLKETIPDKIEGVKMHNDWDMFEKLTREAPKKVINGLNITGMHTKSTKRQSLLSPPNVSEYSLSDIEFILMITINVLSSSEKIFDPSNVLSQFKIEYIPPI